MKVAIYGTGYVGLVSGTCLAELGHSVLCMDVDVRKIARLEAGEVPIFEPQLDELVERNVRDGRLSFTTDPDLAVGFSELQIIAVGTPPDEDGSADLRHVLAVAETIASKMDAGKIVVTKSTVPVGTGARITGRITSILAARNFDVEFAVASNPEFLKEGDAVRDFMHPDRIVIGTQSERARSMLIELYEPLNQEHQRTMLMDIASAELTKYAANAMLATKISFINEIANIAERLGADIEQVRTGIAADPRIGHHFISPGMGYGGSCFPKDVQALSRFAREVGYDARLLDAVEAVNESQKASIFAKVSDHFGGASALAGKAFAVWGLAFKPNTDDMREAPSRTLLEALWDAGARVRAFDPVAMDEARRIYGERKDFELVEHQLEALDGAEALIICTEWPQFRAVELDQIGDKLASKTIFDGRNIFSKQRIADDWIYYGVGRYSPGLSGAAKIAGANL